MAFADISEVCPENFDHGRGPA